MESGLGTIFLGAAAVPLKKMEAALNKEVTGGWQVVFQVIEQKRFMLFWKREAVNQKEEEIRELVRGLPAEKRKAFFEIADKKLKDPDTYATLNYMFIAGLHHFYLERWIRGGLNLGIFLLGIIFLFTGRWGFGLLAIFGITVAKLYSLFLSQIIVQDHNNKVMIQILRMVQPSLLIIE